MSHFSGCAFGQSIINVSIASADPQKGTGVSLRLFALAKRREGPQKGTEVSQRLFALAKSREEAIKNQEATNRSYRIELEKEIHKAKVEAIKLNLRTYQKSQVAIKKLITKSYFTESIIEDYCEADADLTKVINRNGKAYDATAKGNEEGLEFFKTYKSIKEDYETKIDYPLDKSVIADIETELKEKFHINQSKSLVA